MKCILLYLLILGVIPVCNGQGFFKKAEKSVYVLYGHHLKTNYIVDSGNHNLVGRKSVFSAELGMNLDFTLSKRIRLRTGINGHFLFLNEVTYGVTGPVPPGINPDLIDVYGRGIEYIESVTISIPAKVLFPVSTGEKYSFYFATGPSVGFYFPSKNEKAGVAHILDDGTTKRQHWVTRYFKNYKSSKSLGISYPQLEWDTDFECKRKFKNNGALTLGVKFHLGTKRLEYADFIIWPDEPNHRARGHFKLNRSYIGIYSAFTFGKNK